MPRCRQSHLFLKRFVSSCLEEIARARWPSASMPNLGRRRNPERWLERLQQHHPVPAKGLTKAGIRKMIARLHEELAVYEGGQEIKQPETSS
jgi:hypothetical protein